MATADITPHLLHAAHVTAGIIGDQPRKKVQLLESFWKTPAGKVHRKDLVIGLELLERARLVYWDEPRETCLPREGLKALADLPVDVAAQALLHHLIRTEQPLWLFSMLREGAGDATVDMPPSVARTFQSVYPDAGERTARLASLARTVDSELLARIGAEGEECVVTACRAYLIGQGRKDLAEKVQRVSLFDDTLGYDVTATDLTAVRHRLEVKTTTNPHGSVTIYLSRNEVEVGLHDPRWCVVIVRDVFDPDLEKLEKQVVGWVPPSVIEPVLPLDGNPLSKQHQN